MKRPEGIPRTSPNSFQFLGSKTVSDIGGGKFVVSRCVTSEDQFCNLLYLHIPGFLVWKIPHWFAIRSEASPLSALEFQRNGSLKLHIFRGRTKWFVNNQNPDKKNHFLPNIMHRQRLKDVCSVTLISCRVYPKILEIYFSA